MLDWTGSTEQGPRIQSTRNAATRRLKMSKSVIINTNVNLLTLCKSTGAPYLSEGSCGNLQDLHREDLCCQWSDECGGDIKVDAVL